MKAKNVYVTIPRREEIHVEGNTNVGFKYCSFKCKFIRKWWDRKYRCILFKNEELELTPKGKKVKRCDWCLTCEDED